MENFASSFKLQSHLCEISFHGMGLYTSCFESKL